MKLISDIPEDVYTRLFDPGIQDNKIAVDDVCEMARALRMGTPISDNAINGDMVKALFPNDEFTVREYFQGERSILVLCNKDNSMEFDVIWWRSPYKRGDTK